MPRQCVDSAWRSSVPGLSVPLHRRPDRDRLPQPRTPRTPQQPSWTDPFAAKLLQRERGGAELVAFSAADDRVFHRTPSPGANTTKSHDRGGNGAPDTRHSATTVRPAPDSSFKPQTTLRTVRPHPHELAPHPSKPRARTHEPRAGTHEPSRRKPPPSAPRQNQPREPRTTGRPRPHPPETSTTPTSTGLDAQQERPCIPGSRCGKVLATVRPPGRPSRA